MNNKLNLTFDYFSLQAPAIRYIIKKCINTVLAIEGIIPACEINVLITNDRGIQAINKAVRNIDKPTDVLSFPMFNFEAGVLPENWLDFIDPETNLCPLGDIAISIERACTQAREYGHSLRREIGYLTIHSMLHLLGYDHLDEGKQKKQMRCREEMIVSYIPGLKR